MTKLSVVQLVTKVIMSLSDVGGQDGRGGQDGKGGQVDS